MAVLVRGLVRLRTQINVRFPNRDKRSDGWIGDAAHAARRSDHNEDANGYVHAIDVDSDLNHPTITIGDLVHAIVTCRDYRLKYVIHNDNIWYPSSGWASYSGTNPHVSHFHVSAYAGSGNDDFDWSIPLLNGAIVQMPAQNIVWDHKLTREQVMQIQHVLNAWYPHFINLIEDGLYGPATFSAVRYAQSRIRGLVVDGKAGPATRRELGITW